MTDSEITLGIYSADDATAHFRGEDDEMRHRFPSPRLATLETTKAAIARWTAGHESGGPYAYAIRLQAGSLIGGCELRVISDSTAHISYWIFPQFRGKGYATKAVSLLCRAAFGLGIRQLEAYVDQDNYPSGGVAEKAGFVCVGVVKNEDTDGVARERDRWVLAFPTRAWGQPSPRHLNLSFMASHGGTSMKAILAAIAEGSLRARACAAISNNGQAPALAAARFYGIPAYHLSQTKIGPTVDLDDAILTALEKAETEIVVLSGYLRKLGPKTLARFRGCILNIHPALLPKFGGPGMHGLRVHEAMIAAGERVSGASVHLVEENYDAGPILAQRTVPVEIGDTPVGLASRIAEIEPRLFVETLRAISVGTIPLTNANGPMQDSHDG